MAVTGTFLANFDSFVAESKKAELALAGVERESEKVAASMDAVGGGLSDSTLTKTLGDMSTATKDVAVATDLTKLSVEQLDAIIAGTAVTVEGVAAAETTAAVATATWGASLTAFVGTVAGVVSAMAPWIIAIGAVVEGLKFLIEQQGEAALKAEEAAAKQDTINRAIEKGAPQTIQYADAVKYLNEQFQHQQELTPIVVIRRWNDEVAAASKKAYEHAEAERVRAEALGSIGVVEGDLVDVQKLYNDALNKGAEAARKARTEHERTAEAVRRLESTLPGLRTQIGLVDTGIEQTKRQTQEWDRSTKELVNSLNKIQGTNAPESILTIGRAAGYTNDQIAKMANDVMFVGPIFQETAEDVRSFGEQAQQMAGDVAYVLDGLEGKFAEFGATVARTFDAVLGRLAQGDVFGAFVTGAIGAGTAIVNLFRDETVIRINDQRDAWFEAAGGLAAVNQAAFEATGSIALVQAVLDADTPEEYAKAIREIEAAFDDLSKIKAGAARYGPSQSELEQIALDAKAVFDYMLQVGGYTADQLEKAYYDWQVAMANAGNEAAKAWVKAHDEAAKGADAVDGAMKALLDKRKALEDSYANEAPEEFIGVVEAAAREQVAAIDAQIEALKRQAEEASQATEATADDAGESVSDASDRIVNDMGVDVTQAVLEAADSFNAFGPEARDARADIEDAFRDFSIEIPIHFKADEFGIERMAAGGFGTVTKPTLFLAGEAGPEQYAFSGANKRFAGASQVGPSGVTIQRVEIHTTIVADPSDDPHILGEKSIAALRANARYYEAVANVVRRSVP